MLRGVAATALMDRKVITGTVRAMGGQVIAASGSMTYGVIRVAGMVTQASGTTY